MDTNKTKTNWKLLHANIKTQWERLTDEDLAIIDGKRDRFIGKVQEKYGVSREIAEKQIAEWCHVGFFATPPKPAMRSLM